MVWRVTAFALMSLQRSACCRCAASNCCPGLVPSQYLNSIMPLQTYFNQICHLKTTSHYNPGALEPHAARTQQTYTNYPLTL
eukprot:1139124-Pelagomonas_calceolata.AAC.3